MARANVQLGPEHEMNKSMNSRLENYNLVSNSGSGRHDLYTVSQQDAEILSPSDETTPVAPPSSISYLHNNNYAHLAMMIE